jgi:PIN domain nuclease of toxin-antitoxin system
MITAVLDSSAILAVLNRERGSQRVINVLDRAAVSTVNCAEVYSKLNEWNLPSSALDGVIGMVPAIVDFDITLAKRAGELRAATRHLGLSLGDRACLALAEREGVSAFTAEQKWLDPSVGIAVELIR